MQVTERASSCLFASSAVSKILLTCTSASLIAMLAGCGSSNTPSQTGTVTPGTTAVTLLATATANDQLSIFYLDLTNITLTSQSGKTVPLLSSQQRAEFIHLNGTSEPLVTVNVPQDTYTAATATVGSAQFTCAALDTTGGLNTDTFAYGATPASQVKVNLASPITVSGTSMGLSLNLQVSPSATYGTCVNTGIDPYSIDPTFDLSAVTVPTQAANNVAALQGLVSSLNAASGSFNFTSGDGITYSVQTTSNTLFQRIAGLSSLIAGMPVDIDAAVETDGSLAASRVEVLDPDTTDLSLATGPLLLVSNAQPSMTALGRFGQGYLYPTTEIGAQDFSFGSATFQVSGQLANIQNLPFAASFTAATMVPGQNIALTSHATQQSGGPLYVPLTTMTLMPQTLDGTVTAVGTSGQFQTYTVFMAPYDLFPDLAVQAGQTTLLTNPGSAVVYVDSSAQQNITGPIGVGTLVRFTGLIFNDNGTLRMDASSVNTGVTE